MKRRTKKLMSFLLSLALVVGMIPAFGVTAQADDTNTVSVKVVPAGGGTATLSIDPVMQSNETTIQARNGDQVNIFDKPNPGYRLKEIRVASSGVSQTLNGKKCFKVEGTGKQYDVTVEVEKIEYSVHREVLAPTSHLPSYAIDAQYDSVVSWTQKAFVGDPVRLKIVPKEGYEIESVQWQAQGESSWKNVATYDGVGTSFTMPAGDAYFRVDVKEAVPQITTTSLPDGEVGKYYYAKVEAFGGYKGLYQWSKTYGDVPWLLTSSSDFMSLYGTPQEAGTYTIAVRVENYSKLSETKVYSLKINPSSKTNPFVDVSESDYFYEPVLWAVDKGITNGTDETHFSPDATCTRGQVVTFLWRAAGSPAPSSSTNPFTDVNSSDYYYNAVLWAVGKNITNGTSSTTFGPNDGCTRGQVVTFLHRFENAPAPASSTNPFVDVSSSEYYYTPVLWAVGKGITNGTDATHFSPNMTCTRGQIVTFLYRDMK